MKLKYIDCKSTRGFTLLEVVLTLAMSVVLMVLIGGAIQFYGRDMNIRDMDVRQTQLASALIQMIEDDLRATLHLEPADTSALASLLAASGGDQEMPPEDLSAAGVESEPDPMAAETALDLTTSSTVLKSPGLIGDQFQIQVDLSRLPRLEEFAQIIDESASNLDDIPSDIKTVAYFVQPPGTIGGVQDKLSATDDGASSSSPTATALDGGGLVRRSLDRAATAYASVTGGLTMLSQSGDLLAPEVTAIEFEYWDGITWLQAWSSDEYGELPMAVRIRLTMTDVNRSDENATRVFSHIVRLPMARPVDETDDELVEAGI